MHLGLIIGKKNSTGLPGKNTREILGRPAAEYAFIAGKYSLIDELFVSSDCDFILRLGQQYHATLIQRPAELAKPESLTEDVLLHAYEKIRGKYPTDPIKTVSLLFCNNPAVNVPLLNQAISLLSDTDEFDSCFSVVNYDMFAPARARRLSPDDEILPCCNLDNLGEVSSIRNAHGKTYFCDLSIQVMKPRCFEQMDKGRLPFKWQGRRSKALHNDFGFDIDSEWQIVVLEYWLKKHGFTPNTIPWSQESVKTETVHIN